MGKIKNQYEKTVITMRSLARSMCLLTERKTKQSKMYASRPSHWQNHNLAPNSLITSKVQFF